MKKLLALLLILPVFGCASLQFELGKTETVTVRILARQFGYQFAEANPELVPTVTFFAKGLQSGDITLDAAMLAQEHLQGMVENDPYLLEDLAELAAIITVGEGIDEGLADAAIEGFLQGVTYAGNQI